MRITTGNSVNYCSRSGAVRVFSLLALLAGVATTTIRVHRGDNVAQGAQPGQQEGIVEYLWTYRAHDGIAPPEEGTVFLVIVDRKKDVERELVVVKQPAVAALSSFSNVKAKDVYYRGAVPPRDISFHRLDLDGDRVDEVIVTGGGGAGGTNWISVYRVEPANVQQLFHDTSRFGFAILDEDGDGKYEIANPGFKWIAGGDLLRESEFSIYCLGNQRYEKASVVSAASFRKVTSRYDVTSLSPLTHCGAVITTYELKSVTGE